MLLDQFCSCKLHLLSSKLVLVLYHVSSDSGFPVPEQTRPCFGCSRGCRFLCGWQLDALFFTRHLLCGRFSLPPISRALNGEKPHLSGNQFYFHLTALWPACHFSCWLGPWLWNYFHPQTTVCLILASLNPELMPMVWGWLSPALGISWVLRLCLSHSTCHTATYSSAGQQTFAQMITAPCSLSIGTHSKNPSGCLTPRIVPNPIYTVFSCTYIIV